MYKKVVLSVLFSALFTVAWSFQKEKGTPVDFYAVLEQAILPSGGTPLIYRDIEVTFDKKFSSWSRFRTYLADKYGEGVFTPAGELIFTRDLAFSNCVFRGSFDLTEVSFNRSLNIFYSELDGIILNGKFHELNIVSNEVPGIRILDSDYEGKVLIKGNTGESIRIADSRFYGGMELVDNRLSSEIKFMKNEFFPTTGFQCIFESDSLFSGKEYVHNLQMDIKGMEGTRLTFEENTFHSEQVYQRVHFRGILGELNLQSNRFASILDLTGLSIENRLVMSSNHIDQYIAFNDLIFPELYNLVRWDQISGYKIAVFEKVRSSKREFWREILQCDPSVITMEEKEDKIVIPYHGKTDAELANEESFEKLIYSYKSLYTIYNSRGDLESANACYAEMKEIQRRRLKYIYQTEGGFANFFRWQLLILLKIYTNHGTDPALAMVISVYVIFIFAILYFFFPSEWDVTSKSKLIKDFRIFIEKNEKGYWRPFLNLSLGFAISMVNAFTLSLNSFVTLGFGNIPAKGLARYVCILEGFIGWFLLSIFTVALINQVLA